MNLKSVKKASRKIQEFLERYVVGNFIQECLWRFRHLYCKNWAEDYLKSTEHPHREQIIESVLTFNNAESILEIGCASGANLIRLRKALPDAHLIGIDINRAAIRVAHNYFNSHCDKNIELIKGRIEQLSKIKDNSVDIVVSDAVLMFVSPDKIEQVLVEMVRIAKKGLILNEYNKHSALNGHFDGGRWVYDFSALLKKYFPGVNVCTMKSTFSGGLWDEYGCLIKVTL